MALTTYFKADNTTQLNLTGSWDTTGGRPAGPPPNNAQSRARWDNTVLIPRNALLGAAATWGQIVVANPGGACTIGGATLLLTLNPTDGDAAGVSINMSGATQNFTIDTLVALAGQDNTWSFGTTGKTLTVSRIISGTGFGLTIDGTGLFTNTTANSFGGSGDTFALANGAAHISRANSMGSASNAVSVGAGCFLDCTVGIPAQTAFSVTGSGTWDNLASPLRRSAAIWLPNAFNGKTVTLTGATAVVAVEGGSTVTSKFTGTMSAGGTLELVSTGSGTQRFELNNTTNDFYAPGGVTISSRNVTTNAASTGGYGVLASDAAAGANETAIFGSVLNNITVGTTGKLYATPTTGTTRNIGRALTFAGNATADAIDNAATAATTLAFTNALTFSNTGGDVGVAGSAGLVSFRKTISGAGGLRLAAGGYVEFNSSEVNAFSSWTGSVRSQGATSLFLYTAGYSTLTNAFVASSGATIQGGPAGGTTLAHSGYTLGGTVTFQGNALNLGTNAVSAAASTVLAVNTTVTIPGNITGAGTISKSLTGTLILSGANTGITTFNWTAGALYLNSNGASGDSTTVLTQTSTGTVDNTSGSDVSLTPSGNWNWNSVSMTWGGTNNLTRNGNFFTSSPGARTLTFVTAKTAYLKITGTIFNGADYRLNVGGGIAGTKSRFWVVGANLSTANSSTGSNSVTAGYYRIGNNNGLGAAAQTIVWAVSSGGAIELDSGVTTPGTKNGTFVGSGPDNNDGALRATSNGTNKWQGAISIPNTSGARFTAADGATLTLDPTGSPAYSGLDGPTGSSCPVYFDAGISSTLNQDRALASTVGAVYCGNNGSSSGRVVLSKDNNNTGLLTCESGTTALTNKDAIGAGGVKVNPAATLSVEVPSNDYKAVYPGTTTLGGASASKAFVRIGT
jgi:fibronectin-binding autotransporter adhesin